MLAELATVVAALAPLALAIVERRRQTAPERARKEQDADYDRDIQRNAQAAAAGDAATLSAQFEAERQAGIRRGDLSER